MIIHPDDQVLDYFIHKSREIRALMKAAAEVDRVFTGYYFWQWKIRREL